MTFTCIQEPAGTSAGLPTREGPRWPSAHRLGLLLLLLSLYVLCPTLQAAGRQSSGFRIKIAFVFNFLKFTDWPEERSTGDIIVAVIGKTPLAEGTMPVPDAKVGDRDVFVTVLSTWDPAGNEAQDALMAKCHVLFVCQSASEHTAQILEQAGTHAVLTIGESDSFLEQGGIFNFFVLENKVRFDANLQSAKKAKIKIRAKLLRLAKNVTQ